MFNLDNIEQAATKAVRNIYDGDSLECALKGFYEMWESNECNNYMSLIGKLINANGKNSGEVIMQTYFYLSYNSKLLSHYFKKKIFPKEDIELALAFVIGASRTINTHNQGIDKGCETFVEEMR
jgi:hypothetical protein